ncbi:hypothetical protein FKM82_026529 [Ascaphus truei]
MDLNEKLAGLELCTDRKWLETLWVVSFRLIFPRCSNIRILSGRMVLPMYCKPQSHSTRYMTKLDLQFRCCLMLYDLCVTFDLKL